MILFEQPADTWRNTSISRSVKGSSLRCSTSTVNLNGWDPSKARNLFAGQTVYSMVLEVPDDELLAGPDTEQREK